jgi:hypothetical protein
MSTSVRNGLPWNRKIIIASKTGSPSSNPRNFRIFELARHFQDMRAMSAESTPWRLEF